MIAGIVLLAACSSSGSGSGKSSPPSSSTSTSARTSTTVKTTTSSSTTVPASASSTSPPVSALSGPRFVSFTGPPTPVQCNAPTSVRLQWDVLNAQSVDLQINGDAVFATYSNGKHTELEPLACDGTAQVYKLTAHGTSGQTATKTLTLPERKTA